MRFLTSIRRALAALCGVLVVIAVPAHAGAAETLTSTAPSDLAFSMTLDGTDQVVTPPTTGFSVEDSRSSPTAGWRLTASVTLLRTSAPPPLHAAPVNTLSVAGVTASCISDCVTPPTNYINYPVTLTAGANAVRIFDAAANTGTGTYAINPTLQFQVPASAYAGTYGATLTTAVVSGP